MFKVITCVLFLSFICLNSNAATDEEMPLPRKTATQILDDIRALSKKRLGRLSLPASPKAEGPDDPEEYEVRSPRRSTENSLNDNEDAYINAITFIKEKLEAEGSSMAELPEPV